MLIHLINVINTIRPCYKFSLILRGKIKTLKMVNINTFSTEAIFPYKKCYGEIKQLHLDQNFMWEKVDPITCDLSRLKNIIYLSNHLLCSFWKYSVFFYKISIVIEKYAKRSLNWRIWWLQAQAKGTTPFVQMHECREGGGIW